MALADASDVEDEGAPDAVEAAPAPVSRVSAKTGTDGIERNVTIGVEHVFLRLDETRPEALVEQVAVEIRADR